MTVLVVALLACAMLCSAQPKKAAATPAAPLTPFDKAVQMLNKTGYTRFASLVSAYSKMKEVKAILSKPMTMLVPDNAAIDKVKITSYSTKQLATLVLFQALKEVVSMKKLRSLPANTTIATLSVDGKTKKPNTLTKIAGKKPTAVLFQGKPGSILAIVKPDFFVDPKLVVHTTNAVVFPPKI